MECTVSDVFDAFQLCKSIIHLHYYVHFCDPAGELLITIFGNWEVEIGKHDIEYFIILYISQTPSRTNIHVQ